MENLIDYYVWENSFGGAVGKIELSNSKELYQYLKDLKEVK
jgi:hypothetical protein